MGVVWLEVVLTTLIAAATAGKLEAASGAGDGRGVPGRAKVA